MTIWIDDPLGDELQIDFELTGHIVDAEGERRRLWVLIVTLTPSRYQFLRATFTQTVEDVCAGLDAAWSFFDGTIARISSTTRAAWSSAPTRSPRRLQKSFAQYVQLRGISALATGARSCPPSARRTRR